MTRPRGRAHEKARGYGPAGRAAAGAASWPPEVGAAEGPPRTRLFGLPRLYCRRDSCINENPRRASHCRAARRGLSRMSRWRAARIPIPRDAPTGPGHCRRRRGGVNEKTPPRGCSQAAIRPEAGRKSRAPAGRGPPGRSRAVAGRGVDAGGDRAPAGGQAAGGTRDTAAGRGGGRGPMRHARGAGPPFSPAGAGLPRGAGPHFRPADCGVAGRAVRGRRGGMVAPRG